MLQVWCRGTCTFPDDANLCDTVSLSSLYVYGICYGNILHLWVHVPVNRKEVLAAPWSSL